jgi:DNA mismatch repair protein PMS2
MPLPVRRKEFERNAKREFGKAIGLLTGYALVPCASTTKDNNGKTKGVRLTITNTLAVGKKQTNILSPGSGSNTLATAQALWGSKALESVTEFELSFPVEGPKPRLSASNTSAKAQCVSSPFYMDE